MANNIIGDILRALWEFIDDVKETIQDAKERNVKSLEIIDPYTYKWGKVKVYKDASGRWLQDKEGRGQHYNDGVVRELGTGRPLVLKTSLWPTSLNFEKLINGIDKTEQAETLDRVVYAINKKAIFVPAIDKHANIGLLAVGVIMFLVGVVAALVFLK